MSHLIHADNEWRFDLLDEAHTVVARNRRTLEPLSVAMPAAELRVQAAQRCPFCEEEALHTLDRVRAPSGREVVALPSPTPLGFVEHEPPPARAFASHGALAAHELLVPTDPALHGASLADLDEETLTLMLLAFCRRRLDLSGDQRLGGLSLTIPPAPLARLQHVHAATLAVPFAAPRYSSVEICPACRELTDARARGRVVVEGEGVVAWVPWAPRANVHVRMASTTHGTAALAAPSAEAHCRELGRVVVDVVARVTRVAPGAALLLRTTPVPLVDRDDGKSGHLVLEVQSLFDVDGPLSLGFGVRVVSVPPEDLAERLRAA